MRQHCSKRNTRRNLRRSRIPPKGKSYTTLPSVKRRTNVIYMVKVPGDTYLAFVPTSVRMLKSEVGRVLHAVQRGSFDAHPLMPGLPHGSYLC